MFWKFGNSFSRFPLISRVARNSELVNAYPLSPSKNALQPNAFRGGHPPPPTVSAALGWLNQEVHDPNT